MKKPPTAVRSVRAGRPVGATTYEKQQAVAFGAVVRQQRLDRGVAQEELASIAGVERSHIGKIERGTHMPNLALIIKLGNALQCPPGWLVDAAVKQMES